MVKAVGVFKLVPVMVTKLPTEPDEGVKEVMVGSGIAVTLKLLSTLTHPVELFLDVRIKL